MQEGVGAIVVSGSRVTSASIQVVGGSTTVVPAFIAAMTIRSRSARPAAASWTRSLTPAASTGSATTLAATGLPSPTSSPTTSVRYSSPWAFCLVNRASAAWSGPARKA